MEIKAEIEGYTGIKINLDKELDNVENEIVKNGGNLKKDDFKKIRKLIKHKEKHSRHQVIYMTDCIANGIEYNAELEFLDFIVKHGGHGEMPEMDLPLRVTIGVTVALCGYFLCHIPIPPLPATGVMMMNAGIILAVEGTINRMEDNRAQK